MINQPNKMLALGSITKKLVWLNDPTPHSPWPKVIFHLHQRVDQGNKGTAVSQLCDWEHMLQQ